MLWNQTLGGLCFEKVQLDCQECQPSAGLHILFNTIAYQYTMTSANQSWSQCVGFCGNPTTTVEMPDYLPIVVAEGNKTGCLNLDAQCEAQCRAQGSLGISFCNTMMNTESIQGRGVGSCVCRNLTITPSLPLLKDVNSNGRGIGPLIQCGQVFRRRGPGFVVLGVGVTIVVAMLGLMIFLFYSRVQDSKRRLRMKQLAIKQRRLTT
ncbi:hypothetical protein EDD86DRAFT_244491 [Gorgonomyces haynaldii]|nr:hypothetical protein EDD86DRAFT_244491 [Gorgonomyces haynaldii]